MFEVVPPWGAEMKLTYSALGASRTVMGAVEKKVHESLLGAIANDGIHLELRLATKDKLTSGANR